MCLVIGKLILALGPGSGPGKVFTESENAIHSFNKHTLTPSLPGPVFGPEMQTPGKASTQDGAV